MQIEITRRLEPRKINEHGGNNFEERNSISSLLFLASEIKIEIKIKMVVIIGWR